MIEAIRIKVLLDDTNPLIWRELLVPKDINFYKLHHSIQIAMGWTNSHLFEFAIEGYRVGEYYENVDGLNESNIVNAKETKLLDLIDKEGEYFNYEYDFGDGWSHSIIFEKIELLPGKQPLPFCLFGEMKCPPEDCGGIPGFYNLLAVISDKNHPDYKDTKAWVDGKFNATEFNISKINKQLKNIDKYIRSLEE